MHLAALSGHLEVVKWLHDNREERCYRYIKEATSRGCLLVAEYLKSIR
jgi:hypothetical protein